MDSVDIVQSTCSNTPAAQCPWKMSTESMDFLQTGKKVCLHTILARKLQFIHSFIKYASMFLARLYEVQKSYCSHPGIGIRVGFQVKVFG